MATTFSAEIGTDKSYTPGVPIAEDLTKSTDDTLCSESGVTAKGQILLDALKLFAASFANSPWQLPEIPGQDHCDAGLSSQCILMLPTINTDMVGSADEAWDMDMWESSGLGLIELWLSKEWNMNMWKSSGLDLIVPGGSQCTLHNMGDEIQSIIAEPGPELQELINMKIAKAREAVFNHMPIRLLKFDQHGKGITLVERSQVMECISAEIVAEAPNIGPYDSTVFEEYAILSHTWLLKGEITYSDCTGPTLLIDTTSPGYNKLTKFCETAAEQGLRLAWMDTVCINKESSTELDESIRSMFKWYQNAQVCIVYLAETESLEDLKNDRWFTRGWTLQELLAPEKISFYSKHWNVLENKKFRSFDTNLILSDICAATGLEKDELLYSPYNIVSVPIWRKMQWAANRQVTREEDTAYSLMGIFDVSMPTGYGEGAGHAFMRLVREILNSKLMSASTLEIANWGINGNYHTSSKLSVLIPKGPDAYQYATFTSNIHFYPARSPITLSYMGLCVPVLLMPSRTGTRYFNSFTPMGDYSAMFQPPGSVWVYKMLDNALFQNSNSDLDMASQEFTPARTVTMAMLNIGDEVGSVLLPENSHCLAVKIYHKPLSGWEIPEDFTWERISKPCTFDIVCHNNSPIHIPKSELICHGMTLRTMYL